MNSNWIQYFNLIGSEYSDIIEKSEYKMQGYYEFLLKNGTIINIFVSPEGDELYDVVIWNEQFGLPVEDLSYLFNSSPFDESNKRLVQEILEIPLERGWTILNNYYGEKLESVEVFYGIGDDKDNKRAFSTSNYSYQLGDLFRKLFKFNNHVRKQEEKTLSPTKW